MARRMIDIGLEAVTGGADLAISNGDFTMVESTAAHQTELILNGPGEFKQNPEICVGAFDYLEDENMNALVSAISTQFNKDGMNVIGIAIGTDGIIRSNAFYP